MLTAYSGLVPDVDLFIQFNYWDLMYQNQTFQKEVPCLCGYLFFDKNIFGQHSVNAHIAVYQLSDAEIHGHARKHQSIGLG